MMGCSRVIIILLMVLTACKLADPVRLNGGNATTGGDEDSLVLGGSERRTPPSSRQTEVQYVAASRGGSSTVTTSTLSPPLVKGSSGSTTPTASIASQLDGRSSPDATDNLNESTTYSAPTKRRNVNRDNKLMSVLQARRTALSRDRWQKEYHPSSSLKLHRHTNPAVNLVEDSSTPESNLIIPPESRIAGVDEFLDTDESIHGMYVVNPRTGKIALQHTGPQIKLAKETNNFVVQHSNKTEESTKLTSTKPFPGRSSYYDGRGKRTRDRKTFPTSTERAVDDSELVPYQFFGQKLVPSRKTEDSRNQVVLTKGTRLNKLKEDSLEMLEMSAPKPSTEKNKFWQTRLAYQTRNVVAFNNYLRRNKDGIYGVTPVPATSTTTSSTENSVHSDSLTNSMIALSNLSEGPVDPKQVFSRSANFTTSSRSERIVQSTTANSTTTDSSKTTTEIPANHKPDDELPGLFSPTGLAEISKLIINYPDDATPEDLYHANSYQPVADTVQGPTTTEKLYPVPETTQTIVEDYETPRNMVSIPDINHIFQNLSTRSTTTTTTEMPIPVKRASLAETEAKVSTEQYVPVTVTLSTTSTTVSTPELTTTPTTEPSTSSSTSTESTTTTTTTTTSTTTPRPTTPSTYRTPVEVFTEPITEVYPEVIYEEPDYSNSTDSGFNPILSHVFPKLTKNPLPSRPPTLMDFSVTFSSPPPLTHDASQPALAGTKKPTIAFEGVLLQHNSDVVIEMRKMNTATFILAGLGMLPIVIIILYVIKAAVCKRENKVSHDLERYIPDGQPPISPVVRLEQSDTSSVADESIITDRDFNRKNLRFKSLLGEGNFGQVWKAEADDLAGHFGSTRIVAVKTERSDNGNGELKTEADIMRKLGSHPNVVTLLGACLEQEPQLLIMEYAMRGRLLSLLRAARGAVNGLTPTMHGNRTPIMPLSPRRLTGFAHDIARGMEYIADKKIVHRDLAARNVLLDHNGICKICDFGMSIDLEKIKSSQAHIRVPRSHHSESRFKFDLSARSFGIGRHHSHGHHEGLGRHGNHGGRGHDTKSRPALPIRWMAPEALQYHIFSRETDVWAFGIVLWEIATLGCTPYPSLSGREVVRSVPNGARPEIPPDCRPELYDLMQRTWRKDPRQRPSFSESRNCLARTLCQWQLEETDTSNTSEYLDVSGFSEDLEQGMVYFNRRISEFECEI
ncbi:mucin-2 [Ochlerotatus camptorhynchus]|uniref:mucin-2 n=1 Tax=Ochlerotatus camptorhynchus TaxID=644619 RepID=UPI0031D061F9